MPRRYQRERRYICGQSRAAAQYQEVEIYPICEGAQESRDLTGRTPSRRSFAEHQKHRQITTLRLPAAGSAACWLQILTVATCISH